MGIDALLSELFKQGLLGLLAAIALYVAHKKDQQVSNLQKRLFEKSEKDTEKYFQFALEMNNTMKSLTESVNQLEASDNKE